MKFELEEAVKELKFEHTVILRPGLLVGPRERKHVAEVVLNGIARTAGSVSGGMLKDFWAQDADVVARAAVAAGTQCLSGEKKDAVWQVDQAEIVKLGKNK